MPATKWDRKVILIHKGGLFVYHRKFTQRRILQILFRYQLPISIFGMCLTSSSCKCIKLMNSRINNQQNRCQVSMQKRVEYTKFNNKIISAIFHILFFMRKVAWGAGDACKHSHVGKMTRREWLSIDIVYVDGKGAFRQLQNKLIQVFDAIVHCHMYTLHPLWMYRRLEKFLVTLK